jgi:hypothetical protein
LRGGVGPEFRVPQALRDGGDVEVEVAGEEGADFGVFVVALERPSVFCGGGVNVYVDACIFLLLGK